MINLKKGDYVYLKMSDGHTYHGVFGGTEEKLGTTILWLWHQGKRSMFNSKHLLECGRV